MNPSLELTDLLDDPDFRSDDLRLMRRYVEPRPDGTSKACPDGTLFSGVVVPAKGEDLVQTPEGDMVSGDITIFTRTCLTPGDQTCAADLVVWSEQVFKVVNVKPWRFGSGFVEATCKQTEINPKFGPAATDECHAGGYLG